MTHEIDTTDKIETTWKKIRNSGIIIIIALFLPFSFVGFTGGMALNWIWGLGFVIGSFPTIIYLQITPIPFIFSIVLFLIAILLIVTASLVKNHGINKIISYRWIEFGIILLLIPLIYFLLQILEFSIYITIIEDSDIRIFFPINLFIFIIEGYVEISKGLEMYKYNNLNN